MFTQSPTTNTGTTPSFPAGPILHPEQMRATGTRPGQAMRDVVATKTASEVQFTELAPGVWEVDSGRPGPRCVLLGGNHGNEPAGVFAVMRLLHEFALGVRELPRGKVVLAVGNEDGVMANKREVTYNLNRLFLAEPKGGNEPELVRARELQKLLFEPGTFLVDLHSTSQASRPFVVVETSQVDQAFWVPAPTVLCGTSEHFDRYLPGTTQRYAAQRGVTAFTLECGQHDETSTADFAFSAAETFLATYLSGKQSLPHTPGKLVVEFDTVVFKTDETFRFSRKYQGFDTVSKGELLGSGDLGEHRATEDCVVIFPTDPTKLRVGEDLYFLGRKLPGGAPPNVIPVA